MSFERPSDEPPQVQRSNEVSQFQIVCNICDGLGMTFEEDVPASGGLDMFLIPGARGRGLGPDAARTISRWLLSAGRMRRLTVDPYLSNEVAIRGWEKAGFRAVGKREPDQEHSSPWLLMVFDPG